MAEYTPTTDDIFTQFRDGAMVAGFIYNHAEAFELFDRWLASVKAEALREAAEDAGPSLSDGVSGHTSAYSVRKWLRARADQIEGNTE